MVKSVLHTLSKSPPVFKLWLDASHLLRREEATISISTAGTSASVDMDINFTDYGTPITVTIPAASDVGSYSAFLRAAQAAS